MGFWAAMDEVYPEARQQKVELKPLHSTGLPHDPKSSNIRFDNISSLMQPTGARAVGNYRPMTEDILTFSFGYQMEQFF